MTPRKPIVTRIIDGRWIAPMTGRDITPIPTDDGKCFLIPLTRGYFAKIDAEDLPKIGTKAWTVVVPKKSKRVYAYQRGRSCMDTVLMHRLIMDAGPDQEVDHVKRNETLNNTRRNLRFATRSQQNYNTKVRNSSVSKLKGVRFRPAAYTAYLHHEGKKYTFGSFSDPIPAARARDIGAIQLHGEFASLNFPREDYGDVPPYSKIDHRKGPRNKKE
jgi:hypothetical protein